MSKLTETIKYIESLVLERDASGDVYMQVFPWQRKFLKGLLRSDVERAALSIARGNGKSGFLSSIACAYLDGPLQTPNTEVIIVASAADQAKIIFDDVYNFLKDKIESARWNWKVNNSAGRALITHKPTGATLKVKGSDPRRAHGMRPTLVLMDEPAQWPTNTSGEMLSALTTSMGKKVGGKIVALGTRPDNEEHWFNQWLDGDCDFIMNFHAKEDDPIFQKRTIRKANPSLPYMPQLDKTIKNEIKLAKKNRMALQSYKALRLNLGVSDTLHAILIDKDVWRECEVPQQQPKGKCIWGVDLSMNAAMSAVASYWPESHYLEVFAAFPGDMTLEKRGDQDGVNDLYAKMGERGELIVTPGPTVDISELLTEALYRFGEPSAIVTDRWREAELRKSLSEAKIPPCELVVRGNGMKDGSEDVRRFRRAALEGRIKTPESLLLRHAIAGARMKTDDAGNAKLAKHGDGTDRNARHRDDAVAASIIAVAEGDRNPPPPPKPPRKSRII